MVTAAEHKIRWFVYAGNELIPFQSSMRGQWGYEAKCSCGWQTRTGGALRRYVRSLTEDHKRYGD